MKHMNLRNIGIVLALGVMLSACTASVNGSSVQPIAGANCKNAGMQEENCTIGFGSDNEELKLSTDIVNTTLADTTDGTTVNINLRNNSTTVSYAVAYVAGPQSCTTNIFWGPNEAGDGYVATGTGDGCTILYTDSVKSERIQQIALSFTIAQTAYIVITPGNSEDKTQVVITVNATE
jgi:hypothetical protein